MRHLGIMAAAAYALALAGPWAAAGEAAPRSPAKAVTAHDVPAGAAQARPALWRTYDFIVNFHNLPRTYTCDELWYELHGIVVRLGAWPYSINILPYHCSPAPSGDMKSPDVEVRFQLPFFLEGAAARWAPAKAIERTLRLSPGAPATLHPSDCQLMQQISDSLLASLPMRIDEQRFDCSGPARRAADFHVTVSLPMAVKIPAVPSTAAAAPR